MANATDSRLFFHMQWEFRLPATDNEDNTSEILTLVSCCALKCNIKSHTSDQKKKSGPLGKNGFSVDFIP